MADNFEKYFWEDPDASYYVGSKKYWQSVHGKSYMRFNKAKQEIAQKPKAPIEKVAQYINELLSMLGIAPVEQPVMDASKINYALLKEQYELDDERDLIWLKLTQDGYVGVVAQSNDINFDIPSDNTVYDEKVLEYNPYTKRNEYRWKYNSSGILVHKLNKRWDESRVLVFPLSRLSRVCRYTRHDIETAVGNYLIEKNVPIIDYYSHYIG